MPEERSRESGSGSTTLPTEKAMPTPPPKDNSMRSLVILSTTLFAISFLTTVFKAVSEYAWAKPAGETTSFPITVDNNERSGDRLNIDEVELFSRSTSTGLVWSSITLGLIFSFVALYSARRITRHDPYYVRSQSVLQSPRSQANHLSIVLSVLNCSALSSTSPFISVTYFPSSPLST